MAGALESALSYLRSPQAVRERSSAVLEHVLAERSPYFSVDLTRMERAVDVTLAVMSQAYPDFSRIPVHGRVNHFSAGGITRIRELEAGIDDPTERGKALGDLIVTSVLLDAGAGPDWRYVEARTGLVLTRSEGLAVASYHGFCEGAFSSDSKRPWQADAGGLAALGAERLGRIFQVAPENPIVGLEGRAALLAKLGRRIEQAPGLFGGEGRVGGLCSVLRGRARDGQLPASEILSLVLEALGPIWPARTQLEGVELGDVWPHPGAGGEGPSRGLVPLHKLSQWLSYSLIHALESAGVSVTGVDELTGLAEYRNGGLFIDTGVIVPKRPGVVGCRHAAGSELVVEWRALTVALLDRVATELRARTGLDAARLPLGKVLEGGTWAAGRRLAAEARAGAPPIAVESDGTLF